MFNKDLVGGSTDLLILHLIDEKDMYGYEIIEELIDRSNNKFYLKEGSLYPILHKLEKKGFLKSYKAKGPNGRDRKYYKITRTGKSQLSIEKESFKEFSKTINEIIAGDSNVHA